MRNPVVDLRKEAIKEAIKAAARHVAGPVKAGYFAPWRLAQTPQEAADFRNALADALCYTPLKLESRAAIERRLREGFPKKRGVRGGDFAIRNTVIVAALKRISRRGFQNVGPEKPPDVTAPDILTRPADEPEDAVIVTASDILSRALDECGVTLSAARIFDIWKKAPRDMRGE